MLDWARPGFTFTAFCCYLQYFVHVGFAILRRNRRSWPRTLNKIDFALFDSLGVYVGVFLLVHGNFDWFTDSLVYLVFFGEVDAELRIL